MTFLRSVTAASAVAVLLAACGPHQPFALSGDDQKRFGDRVLRVTAAGRPLIFGVHDCTVYQARTAHDDIIGWDVVLRSDWGGGYPKFMTSCTGEAIRYDGRYVRVFLCAQAIGAGGGCAGGGDYRRTADGRHRWEISKDTVHWRTLPP
ncbi:MAG TPA: hypothetical protein VGU66_22375 [Candidatus Elarobacter sp.]|nr:hypothetical protein [Candidatus Elarobacter sp.]